MPTGCIGGIFFLKWLVGATCLDLFPWTGYRAFGLPQYIEEKKRQQEVKNKERNQLHHVTLACPLPGVYSVHRQGWHWYPLP